jgi:hypothetical protein
MKGKVNGCFKIIIFLRRPLWKDGRVKSAKGSIHLGRHSELVAQQNQPWRKVCMCASSNKTARAYRAGTKEPGRDLVSSKEMVIGVRAKRIAGMQEWESPCLCVQACFGELVSFRSREHIPSYLTGTSWHGTSGAAETSEMFWNSDPSSVSHTSKCRLLFHPTFFVFFLSFVRLHSSSRGGDLWLL